MKPEMGSRTDAELQSQHKTACKAMQPCSQHRTVSVRHTQRSVAANGIVFGNVKGSIHTLKENAEALVAATREIGLEVNADRTKYTVMSRDQNAVRFLSVRIDNSTFERVEEFKYLGTTLTNQNSIAEEIIEQIEVRKCLLSFGAEPFVFQVAI